MTKEMCKCHAPPLLYSDFVGKKHIGIDETNNRFGEVNIEECIICGTLWLVYFVEYPFFSKSGRWYRGLIADDEIKGMGPEKSVAFLESLDWYLYGGSYFDTAGKVGSGKVFVDFP